MGRGHILNGHPPAAFGWLGEGWGSHGVECVDAPLLACGREIPLLLLLFFFFFLSLFFLSFKLA